MIVSIVDRAVPPATTILASGTLPKDVIDLSAVIGPFFLAHCFNWALYGILTLQVYIYWLRFPEDLNRYIKWLVFTVFTIDTVTMSFATHAGWTVLVSHWGDVNILHQLDWTWASIPMGSGIVSGLVQGFFVWRIWKLSHSFVMPVIISLVVMTQVAFALKTGVHALDLKNFQYAKGLLPGFWLGGSMLADALISITIGCILWNARTGFVDSDDFIMRLIRLTIEAAAIPTIAAVIKLFLIYSVHNATHLVFCIPLARLYSNCFLAMLNCRDPLFGGGPRSTDSAHRRSQSGSSSWSRRISVKLAPRGTHSGNTSRTATDSTLVSHSIDKTDIKVIPVQNSPEKRHPDLDDEIELGYLPSRVTFNDDASTTTNDMKRNSLDFVVPPPASHPYGRDPKTYHGGM